MYYAEISEGMEKNLDRYLDFSSWIDIPPPDQHLFTSSPDPIVVRQGEEEEAFMQLKSNISSVTDVNFTSIKSTPYVQLSFITAKKPSNAIEPIDFIIKTTPDAPKTVHTIPILANISTESFFPLSVFSSDESFSKKWTNTEELNLAVTVIGPITFPEMFKEFWGTYGNFIGLIAGGFIAGVATLIFDRLKDKRKKSNGTVTNLGSGQ